MNRREILKVAFASTAVAMVGTFPAATFAQESTPEPFNFELNEVSNGARQWEAAGLRMEGIAKGSTTVRVFKSDEKAKEAFAKHKEFNQTYFDYTKSHILEAVIGEPQEVSAPKIGKNRYSESRKLDRGDFTLFFTTLQVQEGNLLHLWLGVGLMNPTEELFDLAHDHMKFDKVDPLNDDEVMALLPTLQDMPEGLVLADETFEIHD